MFSAATLKVLADGAANNIYKKFCRDKNKKYIPDIIGGDLDSADETTIKYFEAQVCWTLGKG